MGWGDGNEPISGEIITGVLKDLSYLSNESSETSGAYGTRKKGQGGWTWECPSMKP